MAIDILPVTVRGKEQFKLRINDVLHGVFASKDEAMEYASLPEATDIAARLARNNDDEEWSE